MVSTAVDDKQGRMGVAQISLYLVLGLIMAAVFIADLLLPLGVAAGVPYVVAVLVSLRSPQRRVTVIVALISTLLTLVGYFWSAPSGIHWMVLVNRALAIGVIWITAYLLIGRKRALNDLSDVSHRLATVFDTVADGVIVINEAGVIESFNSAAERLFGYSSEEAIGKNVSILMPVPESEEHDSYLSRYLTTGERHIIGKGREVIGKRKDGTQFPVRLAIGEMVVGGRRAFTGILHDLTELKSVEKDSMQDAATGMPNRRAFDKFLAAALSRDQAAVLFVDVDKLKSINDELGHISGDKAIATAAEMIMSSLRTTDPGMCARIGGDEFAVVLPHNGDSVAMIVANRIISAAQPALQAIHPAAGVSIGVASAPRNTSPEELLHKADQALYRAKETRGIVSL